MRFPITRSRVSHAVITWGTGIGQNTWGSGTGAASLIGHERWNQGEEKTTLSMQDEMEEYMFLGLRKMEGRVPPQIPGTVRV